MIDCGSCLSPDRGMLDVQGPQAPGQNSYEFTTQEVAEHVLGLMNGECYRWTGWLSIEKLFC